MNRLLLLLMLIVMGQAAFAQYVYTIKADSVKITNSCDTAELIIENHTQTVPGFLFNKGRGRTEFRRGAVKINENSYLIGTDTLYIPHVNANNGTSLANGNLVLGNDAGSTAAQLMNTREIPLNGNNVVFTGDGKIGIGTNNPRELLEIGAPSAGDNVANLRFTDMAEPTTYTNVISNSFSGNPFAHNMSFSLKSLGTSFTPLQLTAEPAVFLNGTVVCTGNGSRGTIDLLNTGTFTDANMIALRFPDQFHYHLIKASFNGAWPWLNKIQFFLSPGVDPGLPTINPLNLLGDGNSIFNGNIGVQNTAPSAHIHVGAGTTASATAPIKLTTGALLTTPEDGAIEFDGTDLYLTENGIRNKLSKTLSGQLTTNFGGISLNAFTPVLATLTVAGAQPGDVVNVSANSGAANPSSIIISAFVTSANLVTLQAYNASNSAVTLVNDTYKVRVIK